MVFCTLLAVVNYEEIMTDLPIIARIIIVLCLAIIAYVISYLTPSEDFKPLVFSLGVACHQLIDGIVARYRFH